MFNQGLNTATFGWLYNFRMRVQLIRLRVDGVLVPKYEIRQQVVYTGDLRIFDELENGYNRVLKIGEFKSQLDNISRLLDVEIVWMNEDRMTLKGFEQKPTERGLVDYAQSWLITILAPEPAKEDEFGRRFNVRR